VKNCTVHNWNLRPKLFAPTNVFLKNVMMKSTPEMRYDSQYRTDFRRDLTGIP
jgi:hypothetical protein